MTSNYEKDDSQKTEIHNPQSAIGASAIRNSQPAESSAFAALRRFVRARAVVERCEMCSAELATGHQHLVEPKTRQLICACQPCAVLFCNQSETKYKSVPRRIRFLQDFQLTDAEWDNLALPINMAFFFHSTPDGKVVALYPSPAGPMESLLSLDTWDEIVQDNPVLKKMEPDVEALLVNRVENTREYFLAPIDECYKLVGLIRAHWRGLSGGAEVWAEIVKFFDELKRRAD
jgi:Family of unknown function (DUF5947)